MVVAEGGRGVPGLTDVASLGWLGKPRVRDEAVDFQIDLVQMPRRVRLQATLSQALSSAQTFWTRADSKSSNIRQRRQGSIARVQFSIRVDRLNANLIGAGFQMRPEALVNRRCVAPEHHCIDESV
jgi:hypothetical protein